MFCLHSTPFFSNAGQHLLLPAPYCTLCFPGKRGLGALALLNLPPPSPGGRTGPPSSSNAPQGNTTPDLWTPGNPNLGAFVNPEYSAPRFQPQSGGATGSSTGSGLATSRTADSMTADVAAEPLPGLTLLQGMAVVGPGGRRTEEYSRPASRSKPGGGSGVTAGIGAPGNGRWSGLWRRCWSMSSPWQLDACSCYSQ